MGTKKRKTNKTKQTKNIKNEVINISVVTFGLFLALSIYTKQGGFIGKFLQDIIIGTIGISGYTLPVIILILSFLLFRKKTQIIHKYKFLIPSLLLNVSSLAHIFNYYNRIKLHTNISIFNMAYFKNGSWSNGGLIGSVIGNILLKLLGLYGSYIILISILIIIITIGTNISIIELLNNFFKKTKNTFYNLKLKFQKKNESRKREKELLNNINNNSSKPSKKTETKQKEKIKSKTKKSTTPKVKRNKSKKPDIKIPSKPTTYHDNYTLPDIELLEKDNLIKTSVKSKKSMISNGKRLEETLESFGVKAKVLNIHKGPTVTRYEIQPESGVKVSKIVNLSDDIALNLAATGIRIEAPIPGKSAIGIEVPNTQSSIVNLRGVIEETEFEDYPSKLAFGLGKDIGGKPIITDVSKMPHLLIAGATGSGKSVCINTLIISILYKSHPSEVKLIMIDPKVVELSVYNGIPHLLIPVVTDPKKASSALFWAVEEMNSRYKTFANNNVRDISGYNEMIENMEDDERIDENGEVQQKMPQIVIIIDELADLMMSSAKEVEDAISRLAQMARAAGIHLVIATQRPSVDVITGVIKANIPSRLAFSVSSGVDSRTILDMNGAEKLLGKGDMLFYPTGASKPVRIQGAYVSDEEVKNIVHSIKSKQEANYKKDIIKAIEKPQTMTRLEETDELLDTAIDLILDKETASISFLQRSLRVGFNRASRIMDSIESMNIVGPDEGNKPRKILITREDYESEDAQ